MLFLLLVSTLALPNTMPWEEWKKIFKKDQYLSSAEHDYRKAVYLKNVEWIKQENAKGLSHTVGVNQFADMSFAEWRKAYLPTKFNRTRRYNVVKLPETPAADSFDWRTQNAVTPVKNQGHCGSCWSFSTTGAVEGCVAIANGTLLSLSEQQLVNCDTPQSHGCGGGLMDYGFEYIAKNKGINTEANWGYTASDGQCNSQKESQHYAVTLDHVDVEQDSDAQFVAALNKGPVSVAIEADQQAFQFYTSGVFSAACGTNLDHGVLTVGYASNYYIVKNSWGSSWGEAGYIRFARGISQTGGQCGILMNPSFPTQCQRLTPGPTSPPGPTPSPGTEPYADPTKGCKSGENPLSVTNVAGSVCAKDCTNDFECPDQVDGTIGYSLCGVWQGSKAYCAIFCNPQVQSACAPARNFTCKQWDGAVDGQGICTYDS